MSQKWQRSKAWDDQHFPSWAWPFKFLLRAFSSITLAVIVLIGVALYAVFASVPIGMLALIPTWLIKVATLVVPFTLIAFLIVLVANRLPLKRTVRFPLVLGLLILLGVGGTSFWAANVWPALHYDAATNSGFRLFPAFVTQYQAITLRRLPPFEMTELEFYSWWPMRLLLMTFIINMFIATIRRIEFTFKNLGVLTVHTGIITIALGSIYYQKLKKEGDTLLISGRDVSGAAAIGPPQATFYDNTAVVLYVAQDHTGLGPTAWEQRPIKRLPRYNDYALDVGDEHARTSLWRTAATSPWQGTPQRSLNIPLAPTTHLIDDDINFRIVGYCSYGRLQSDYLEVAGSPNFARANPLRVVSLFLNIPDQQGLARTGPAFEFTLLPNAPIQRISENEAFGLEYTIGMDQRRWNTLALELPPDTSHALSIEIPGEQPLRIVTPIAVGDSITIGDSGYRIQVEQISPTPPMPIITRGYEDAPSAVAIVRITNPAGQSYTRWLYSRFSEINQDILDAVGEGGRPLRRTADPAILIDFIDASRLQVYLDERDDGSLRALVRQMGGDLRVLNDVPANDRITDVVDRVDLQVTTRWQHAERFERPRPVPPEQQQTNLIGSHQEAAVAVEVSATVRGEQWVRTLWVPFSQYMGMGPERERAVRLPDGRALKLAFGRRQHRFPDFHVQLVNFEMIAYDHRGAPRDYQSTLRVSPTTFTGDSPSFNAYEHICKLNAPLRAPYHWDDSRTLVYNLSRRFFAGINPNQYKLSQSGWDQQGWNQSQELVDQGIIDKPLAQFTILGVGNNPGIHVVALGSILMGIGIPWAFYIKPYLVRREADRLRRKAAAQRLAPAQQPLQEVGT